MADIVGDEAGLAVNIEAYVDFKADVLSKFNWKYSDWEINQLVDSNLHFLVKNIKFWFRNLAEVQFKKYIVLTSYSLQTKSKLSLVQISKAFKKQFGMGELMGASESLNRNYIVLQVKTEDMRQKVISTFCTVGQHFIISSDWITPVKHIEFAINWLPPDIPLEDVHEEISKLALVSSIKKADIDLEDGDFLTTGKILGTLNISMLPMLESLPHILTVAGFKAHWIIYLRQPLCLACRNIGHMAASCPTPYCSLCRCLSARGHVCRLDRPKVSYAMVVKVPDISQLAAVDTTGLVQEEIKSQVNLLSLSEGKTVKEGVEHPDVTIEESLANQYPLNMDTQTIVAKRSFQQMVQFAGSTGENNKVSTYSKKNPVKMKTDFNNTEFQNADVFK